MRLGTVLRAAAAAAAAITATACASYPAEPRYSIHADPAPARRAPPPGQPAYPTPDAAAAANEPAPLATAPTERIEGGALPPPAREPAFLPAPPSPAALPVTSGAVVPGAAYVIQPGDTISGVGRRFQTPVQTLIDLNGLGTRGAISAGQNIILPDSAVDTGPDPYATGPSPVGVMAPNDGVPPPPPPPDARLTPTPRSASSMGLQWPVRGDILRRFGPVGMGERNNGINIGASAGAEVRAAGDGRVAYVGDDLVGQGLTVLIVHRDGWRTVYGHLGSATVDDGDQVRQGQVIGTVGLTAGDGRPSMHFETRRMQGDDPVAIDPLTVLPR